MIELDIHEYCQKCPNFKPEHCKISDMCETFHVVSCVYKYTCKSIYRYLKDEVIKNETC